MSNYDSLTPSEKLAVDTLYRDRVNVLLDTMSAVNNVRMAPDTLPAVAATLDAKYADLQLRLALVEAQMTSLYSNGRAITPPSLSAIAAITTLAAQVDQLNKNIAVASAMSALAGQALTSATDVLAAV